jgi:hypothetical protein
MGTEPDHTFKHGLHFYQTERDYLVCLVNYLHEGLEANEQCIIVATEPHRKSIRKALNELGYNVDLLEAFGQIIELDATQTLSHFMKDGMPDEESFHQIVGSIVPHTGTQNIRAFGEMVVLLWQSGNADGAIALEQLWNKLGKIRDFKLLCSYPEYIFEPKYAQADKERISGLHAKIHA